MRERVDHGGAVWETAPEEMLENFVFVFMMIIAYLLFAVSSREPSQGFREVESFPGLADPGVAPVRDVPGHAAHN